MNLRISLLILAIISLTAIGGVGFFLATHLTSTAWDVARAHTDNSAEMIQQRIGFSLFDKQLSANALAKTPEFARSLEQDVPADDSVNRLLLTMCDNLQAPLCYLMDRTGNTVAASDFNSPNSILGNNYAFRPYFQQAIAGRPALYPALGVTTKKRGFYFSAPIVGDQKQISGILVVKYAVETVEKELSDLKGFFALINPKGVIFASNKTAWLYHSFTKLSADEARDIVKSRQFGDRRLNSVNLIETEENLLSGPDGINYIHSRRSLPFPAGWHISYLYDTANVTSLLDRGIGDIPVKALMLLLFPTIAAIILMLYRWASREISMRLDTEANLRESEEKYRLLFEQSEDPMWVIYDNLFMIANEAAARTLGYTSVDELCRLHPSKLSPEYQPDGDTSFDKANRMMEIAYRQGYHRFEWEHRRKNGQRFPVEVSLTRIPFQHHDALYCVWRDISEQKQTLQTLDQARREAESATKSKSEFLANMSHEIRTPMNAILGMTELALQSDLNERQKNYIGKARLSAKHLLGIIDDILDYSKIEAGKLVLEESDFALTEIVDNLMNLLRFTADERGVRISTDLGADVPTLLKGDALRLGQVLINLAGNAVKFSHEGGEVRIGVALREQSETEALLAFSIEDQGIGISRQQLETLFQPFTQADGTTSRKYGGTGLGLVISKNLVEKMGGEIKATSRENVGSTFSFSVPLKKQPVRSQPSDKEKTVGPNPDDAVKILAGRRVLLVEDNAFNRELAVELLSKRGIRVETPNNGREALERLSNEDYDAVLMDCQMPEMDGYEATRRLRQQEKYKLLPIIALTAHAMKGDREKAMDAGMNDYITKPIDTKLMLSTLAKWVESK